MFQGHVDNEARQLQSETDSSHSPRFKSIPSTSDEHAGLENHESGACKVNTNVNTPRKILLKISPVLEIPRGIYSKRKQSATVLT
jgi:hypothetical protein